MFHKLKDRIGRARFARRCSAALGAPPVSLDPASDLALFSQLQHKDLLMFLLAAKSFARQVPPRAVYVLNDGSLTGEDRAVLAGHLPGMTVFELPQFRSRACPSGGCWERLLAISELVRERYVIQLDSDTLSVGPIDEVRACVTRRTAFALGTWDRQENEEMREQWETAVRLKPGSQAHVQLVAEANFDKLKDFASLRYIRGCAGFAGFPRGSFTREFVESISAEMRAAIGSKWDEWGSEQVMSNIVVANIPGAVVLPHPKYSDCRKMRAGETVFIHFIGSCRFSSGRYARLGARVITELNAHHDALQRASHPGGGGGEVIGPDTR